MAPKVGKIPSSTEHRDNPGLLHLKKQSPKDIKIFGGGSNNISTHHVNNLPNILSGNCSYGT